MGDTSLDTSGAAASENECMKCGGDGLVPLASMSPYLCVDGYACVECIETFRPIAAEAHRQFVAQQRSFGAALEKLWMDGGVAKDVRVVLEA